jgi:hypothetical protein
MGRAALDSVRFGWKHFHMIVMAALDLGLDPRLSG